MSEISIFNDHPDAKARRLQVLEIQMNRESHVCEPKVRFPGLQKAIVAACTRADEEQLEHIRDAMAKNDRSIELAKDPDREHNGAHVGSGPGLVTRIVRREVILVSQESQSDNEPEYYI